MDFKAKLSNNILPAYGNLLKWSVVIIAGYQLLWGLLQHVIWSLPYIKYEKWACLVLIIACAVYLALCAAAAPERLKKLVQKMKKYCTYEQLFLVGLVVWYAISCLVRKNIENPLCFKHNDNRLFITWTSAFILFPLAEIMGPKRIRRFVETMIHIMTIIYVPICIFAITKFYHNEEVVLPSGKYIKTYNNASIIIGGNRNITAAASALLLMLCIYMIVQKQKWIRWLYIGAAVVYTLVLILSNSRTSFLAALVFLDLSIAVICCDMLRSYGQSTNTTLSFRKCILFIVVVVVLFTVSFILLRKFVIMFFASSKKMDLKVRNDYTYLNGRRQIWATSLRVMLTSIQNFMFGVTPSYVPNKLLETGMIDKKQPHAHNLVLQVGASLGIPSMILHTVFLVLLYSRCIRIIWERVAPKKDRRIFNIWPISVSVLLLLVIEMVEVMTFTINVVNLPVFYILAGWIRAVDRRCKRSVIQR